MNQSLFDDEDVIKLKVQSASDWRIVQKLKLLNNDLCQKQVASCHLNKSDIGKSSGCPSLLQTAFWQQIQWEQSPRTSAEYYRWGQRLPWKNAATLGALSQSSVAGNPMSRLVQTVMEESIEPSAVEQAMPHAVNTKLMCHGGFRFLRSWRKLSCP